MNIDFAQLTDPGRKRPNNEDTVGWWAPDDPAERARAGCLYLVADGVGGGSAGEVASRYAVDKVLHSYFSSEDEPNPGERLAAAVEAANRDIYEFNLAHPEQREMGSTLVAALVRGQELLVANVGDSRAYLVHGDAAVQLTQDHNVVAGMLRRGEIDAEAAADHPLRSRLTRCLGIDLEVSVDLFEQRLEGGDSVVLCSDGLTAYVGEAELAQVVTTRAPHAAARELVRLANERGGRDNISVMILHPSTAPGRGTKRQRRTMAQPDLDTTLHTLAAKKRRWPFSLWGRPRHGST